MCVCVSVCAGGEGLCQMVSWTAYLPSGVTGSKLNAMIKIIQLIATLIKYGNLSYND